MQDLRQTAAATGRLVTGRQALYDIYRQFAMSPNIVRIYGITDLVNAKRRGDKQKAAFN